MYIHSCILQPQQQTTHFYDLENSFHINKSHIQNWVQHQMEQEI